VIAGLNLTPYQVGQLVSELRRICMETSTPVIATATLFAEATSSVILPARGFISHQACWLRQRSRDYLGFHVKQNSSGLVVGRSPTVRRTEKGLQTVFSGKSLGKSREKGTTDLNSAQRSINQQLLEYFCYNVSLKIGNFLVHNFPQSG